MANISQLRSVVNQGWTIANRNLLKQQIGQKQYNKFNELLKQVDYERFELPTYSSVQSFF